MGRDERPAGRAFSADPKDGLHGSPTGNMMLLAENIGNFPLTRFDPGMLLGEPGRKIAPGQAASRVMGGPRQCRLPPTVPGAPLRVSPAKLSTAKLRWLWPTFREVIFPACPVAS